MQSEDSFLFTHPPDYGVISPNSWEAQHAPQEFIHSQIQILLLEYWTVPLEIRPTTKHHQVPLQHCQARWERPGMGGWTMDDS